MHAFQADIPPEQSFIRKSVYIAPLIFNKARNQYDKVSSLQRTLYD